MSRIEEFQVNEHDGYTEHGRAANPNVVSGASGFSGELGSRRLRMRNNMTLLYNTQTFDSDIVTER
ncbi:hypothetical protein HanPSC8_Chr13g0566451 [Helianthus annuus]|nr:hypothetical protein HanPSC8_Chr13g0566451 [Helianthus annuus]